MPSKKTLLLISAGIALIILATKSKARPLQTSNITVISFTLDKIECIMPCSIIADVTWKNIGKQKENFIPSVIVDDIIIYGNYGNISQTLDVGKIFTDSFIININKLGNYDVCPEPNP